MIYFYDGIEKTNAMRAFLFLQVVRLATFAVANTRVKLNGLIFGWWSVCSGYVVLDFLIYSACSTVFNATRNLLTRSVFRFSYLHHILELDLGGRSGVFIYNSTWEMFGPVWAWHSRNLTNQHWISTRFKASTHKNSWINGHTWIILRSALANHKNQ